MEKKLFKQGWFISTIVTLVNFFHSQKGRKKRPIVAKIIENIISKFNRRFKEREKNRKLKNYGRENSLSDLHSSLYYS